MDKALDVPVIDESARTTNRMSAPNPRMEIIMRGERRRSDGLPCRRTGMYRLGANHSTNQLRTLLPWNWTSPNSRIVTPLAA
jgi:hypothetical protein